MLVDGDYEDKKGSLLVAMYLELVPDTRDLPME
jgi:hypothetical protein